MERRGSQGDQPESGAAQRARGSRRLPACLSRMRHYQQLHISAAAGDSGISAGVEAAAEVAAVRCDRPSSKLIRSAEVFDEHGLGLFLTGLVEGDGVAVESSAEPKRGAVEDRNRGGALVREVVKTEDGLMPERRAYK